MLDIWRVSRIASDDILEGHTTAAARSPITETSGKSKFLFPANSRRCAASKPETISETRVYPVYFASQTTSPLIVR